MSQEYSYTVDDSVLEIFASTTRKQREKLLRLFAQLAGNPFQKGDALQSDSTGRQCQVKRFEDWSVTWWPDHLDEKLHIIAVEHLRL